MSLNLIKLLKVKKQCGPKYNKGRKGKLHKGTNASGVYSGKNTVTVFGTNRSITSSAFINFGTSLLDPKLNTDLFHSGPLVTFGTQSVLHLGPLLH